MRRSWPAVLVTAACLVAGCTEDSLVAPDSGSAPGASAPTIEVVLDARDLPLWRDTTYVGFVIPATAAFRQLSDRPDLRARLVGRFETIPDSVFVDPDRVAVDRFTSAYIRVTIDTIRSTIPEDGAEVVAWALGRGFEETEVTWTEARRGDPWATPGGDLDALLGEMTLTPPADADTSRPDSLILPLQANVDSLLRAWRDAGGEEGYAVVAGGDGADLRVLSVALVMQAVPEGIDTVLTIVRGAVPSAFIFDPPTPDATTRLRLGGLPSARFYVDFQLPDSLGFVPLRGATISRAALEFTPAAAAPSPFRQTEIISSQAVRLLADPFEYGEKTPIGALLGARQSLDPDSLASGQILRYDITGLLIAWSGNQTAVPPPLRVGIVPVPENREFGYWEMFSAEDGPGVRPVVRILFTPNPRFRLP